eukprot:scaffold35168_cov144-Skeletonema_dohrnii-CCMP3373.AAC.2
MQAAIINYRQQEEQLPDEMLLTCVSVVGGMVLLVVCCTYERNQYAEFSNAEKSETENCHHKTNKYLNLYLVEVGRSCAETTVISN